jgi:RHS repeat-associated protein
MITGDSSAHAYYHADGNGNVTALIATNQAVVARYLYDPYGNQLAATGPLAEANLYRFSSKEWHPQSGLVYYGYRFYDPSLQRWGNRDPLSEWAGANLYRFVRNGPLAFLDSWGLFEGEDENRPLNCEQLEAEIAALTQIAKDPNNLLQQFALDLIPKLQEIFDEFCGDDGYRKPCPKPQPTRPHTSPVPVFSVPFSQPPVNSIPPTATWPPPVWGENIKDPPAWVVWAPVVGGVVVAGAVVLAPLAAGSGGAVIIGAPVLAF